MNDTRDQRAEITHVDPNQPRGEISDAAGVCLIILSGPAPGARLSTQGQRKAMIVVFYNLTPGSRMRHLAHAAHLFRLRVSGFKYSKNPSLLPCVSQTRSGSPVS